MWIRKKDFMNLEKRVADLEKSQLQAVNMVKEYIIDTESLSNSLSEEIKKLPEIIKRTLNNNC